jgi:hypothetical protein
VFESGLVWAALDGGILSGTGPVGGLDLAGNAGAVKMLEEARGRVGESIAGVREVVGGAETAYRGVPPVSPKKVGGGVDRLT